MSGKLPSILDELEERRLVWHIEMPVERIRAQHRLASNTISNTEEFDHEIGSLVQDMYRDSSSADSKMDFYEAVGKARRFLESVYRRRGQTLQNAIDDAITGRNGGVRQILDHIVEGIKAERLEHYLDITFNRHIAENSWPERVAIVKEIMDYYGDLLPDYIRRQPPERWASEHKELLNSVLRAIREAGTIFRRM